jgi:hypothetical protein
VDLTHSYRRAFPQEILERYEFDETRNAAAVLHAADPLVFDQVADTLRDFQLLTEDLVTAGGNQSKLAARLNGALRAKGFREAAVDTSIDLELRLMPYRPAGERAPITSVTTVRNTGYKVDGFVNRFALDVEWNAKDGNLDRDLAAYRAMYDFGLIDVGVMITRTHFDLRRLAFQLRKFAGMDDDTAAGMLKTTTTTNRFKLQPKLTRGDGGGCPILAVYICEKTWEGWGRGVTLPDVLPPDLLE